MSNDRNSPLLDWLTPDPLGSGHITGQNPGTPKREPKHTATVKSELPHANEEELGGRPAFLFRAGGDAAVTFDSSGANLPPSTNGSAWTLAEYITLGVRDATVMDRNPEAIISGIKNEGYYVWKPGGSGGGSEGTNNP